MSHTDRQINAAEKAAYRAGIRRTLINSFDRVHNIKVTRQLIDADAAATLACLQATKPTELKNLKQRAAEVVREWESHNGSDGAVYLISTKALKICSLLANLPDQG